MGAAIARTVVTVMLALLCPLTTAAAPPRSPDFDMCSAQKPKDCRRVSVAELDRMRGGMLLMTSIGPIEVTFGVTQAVYINNKLVAVTELVTTPLASTSSQIQAASAALQSASARSRGTSTLPATSAPAGTAPSGVQTATPMTPVVSAAPTSVTPTRTSGLNGTLKAVPTSAGARGQTTGSSSQAAAASSPSGSVSPTASVNGSVVTPGNPIVNVPRADGLRVLIVQNGAGNVVVPSAADIASGVGTIIQNTANSQTIRAVTEMNVQIALTRAMNAASISNAVRQGMITSRP